MCEIRTANPRYFQQPYHAYELSSPESLVMGPEINERKLSKSETLNWPLSTNITARTFVDRSAKVKMVRFERLVGIIKWDVRSPIWTVRLALCVCKTTLRYEHRRRFLFALRYQSYVVVLVYIARTWSRKLYWVRSKCCRHNAYLNHCNTTLSLKQGLFKETLSLTVGMPKRVFIKWGT